MCAFNAQLVEHRTGIAEVTGSNPVEALIFFSFLLSNWGQRESRILAGYYGFNANISFTFQAIKNLYAHPRDLCFGPFCKFFGDF